MEYSRAQYIESQQSKDEGICGPMRYPMRKGTGQGVNFYKAPSLGGKATENPKSNSDRTSEMVLALILTPYEMVTPKVDPDTINDNDEDVNMNDDDIDYDAEWPALEEMIGDDDHLTDIGEDLYMNFFNKGIDEIPFSSPPNS
ncbi:unnamed protein product [Prunus armeniaca]